MTDSPRVEQLKNDIEDLKHFKEKSFTQYFKLEYQKQIDRLEITVAELQKRGM